MYQHVVMFREEAHITAILELGRIHRAIMRIYSVGNDSLRTKILVDSICHSAVLSTIRRSVSA